MIEDKRGQKKATIDESGQKREQKWLHVEESGCKWIKEDERG